MKRKMKIQWNLSENPENRYDVDKEKWAKLPRAARALFNRTMYATELEWHFPDPIRRKTALVAAEMLARMLKAAGSGK
jgi:hypothetical protein